MTDALKLSQPSGKDTTETTNLINALEQAQLKSRTEALEKNIADLTKALDSPPGKDKDKTPVKKQAKSPPAAPPGKTRHVAHAEGWKAVTTQPDFCRVGKDIVAFDSCATLDKKHKASANVIARGTPVYRQGDMFKEVQGDAGQHIVAGTSQGSGYVKILDGHSSVKVNNIPVARHDSLCMVNCNAAGVGGALGKLVTEQKGAGASPSPSGATNPSAPPGERTSEKLERLKEAKAKLESGQLDFNALDEYVNFKEANQGLADAIGGIKGAPGTAGDYAAQATRGVLGFAKDIVMGIGELAYEAGKAVPKLGRMAYTSTGQAITQLDGAIFAENIRLGNITPGTVGQGALDIGSAIVKPVTDPWNKGQYVEAVTRAAAEIATLPIAWTKAQKAAQATKIKAALELENAAKAKAALELEEATKAKAALDADNAAKLGDGVHVKFRTFEMREMLDRYKGENLPGNKQWPGQEVKYLTPEERIAYQLEIKNGKFYDSNGNLFDTAGANSLHSKGDNAIFVMDGNGNIFASKVHAAGEFHHSSFLSGNPVSAAGEIKVTNGNLEFISGRSGHYQPPPVHLDQAIDVLQNKGVDITKINRGTF